MASRPRRAVSARKISRSRSLGALASGNTPAARSFVQANSSQSISSPRTVSNSAGLELRTAAARTLS
jgi:hypothetical protein